MEKYGIQEADAMKSRLCAVKSMRKYNNLGRVMPGAVFLYRGKRYVLRGQLTDGKYYRADGMNGINFPAKDCTVVCRNTGLVFA